MKQSTFNDLEALEMAITIERRGENFYNKAAEKVDSPNIIDILKDLAVQEKDHADIFRDLYNQAMDRKDEFDDTYLFDTDIAGYLRAMVSTSVFPSDDELESIIKRVESVEDVIKLGIQAEKDSILFYTEMVIHSKLPEAKDAFRSLLKEEKKHLIDLQYMLK